MNKIIRYSWQILDKTIEQQPEDGEIADSLSRDIPISEDFKNPAGKDVAVLCALPSLVWMNTYTHENHKTATHINPWYSISEESREEIIKEYRLRNYKYILHFAASPDNLESYVSYVAATFAFSTKIKPLVQDMSDIVEKILSKSFFPDDKFLEQTENKSFLIIRNFLNIYPNIEKVTGTLSSILGKRHRKGLFTLFTTVASESFMRDFGRDSLTAEIERSIYSKTSIKYYLSGEHTLVTAPLTLEKIHEYLNK